MSCTNKITYITLYTSYEINIIDAKVPLFSFNSFKSEFILDFIFLKLAFFFDDDVWHRRKPMMIST